MREKRPRNNILGIALAAAALLAIAVLPVTGAVADPLWTFKTGDAVGAVAMSPDGRYVAAGSSDNTVYFFKRDGTLLWSYDAENPIESIAISPDSQYIAAGSFSDTIHVFNQDGSLVWSFVPGSGIVSRSIYVGKKISSITFSSDSCYLAAGSYDNKVYLFSMGGTNQWVYLAGDNVKDVAISSDTRKIVAGSKDGKVYCLDRAGDLVWMYDSTDEITSVALSSDDRYVAAGSNDGRIFYFQIEDGRLIYSHDIDGAVRSLSIIDDSGDIVVGSSKGLYTIQKQCNAIIIGYGCDDSIFSVSCSSDGRNIVTGSTHGTVNIFGPNRIPFWSYQTGDATSVTISRDGRYVAAGSWDNRIYFFENTRVTTENPENTSDVALNSPDTPVSGSGSPSSYQTTPAQSSSDDDEGSGLPFMFVLGTLAVAGGGYALSRRRAEPSAEKKTEPAVPPQRTEAPHDNGENDAVRALIGSVSAKASELTVFSTAVDTLLSRAELLTTRQKYVDAEALALKAEKIVDSLKGCESQLERWSREGYETAHLRTLKTNADGIIAAFRECDWQIAALIEIEADLQRMKTAHPAWMERPEFALLVKSIEEHLTDPSACGETERQYKQLKTRVEQLEQSVDDLDRLRK